MFSFLLKTCTSCDNLEDAICSIDAVLAQYGKNAWQNTAFMTIKPTPHLKVRQLLYYKEILNNLRWNQDFYCSYSYSTIVSRVRALTGGEFRIARRMKAGPFTTTTTTTSTSSTSTTSTTSTSTTSTTSTSTSSTTSTTTSTTTHSTTSTSTSTTTSTTNTTTSTTSTSTTSTSSTTSSSTTTTTTTAGGPVVIDFTTVNGISNSSGVWTVPGGGSDYGHTGLATLKLAAGVDGIIYFDGTSVRGVLGFSTANSLTAFGSMIAGIVMDDISIYKIDGGAVTGPLESTVTSNKYGIRRTGSTITIEKSSNGGASWSVVSTLSSTSSANLFIVCDINGAGHLDHPIGLNIA